MSCDGVVSRKAGYSQHWALDQTDAVLCVWVLLRAVLCRWYLTADFQSCHIEIFWSDNFFIIIF